MANPNPNPKNRFKKGHVGVAGPGRPPGSTNVLPRDIKSLLREAAANTGFMERVPVLDPERDDHPYDPMPGARSAACFVWTGKYFDRPLPMRGLSRCFEEAMEAASALRERLGRPVKAVCLNRFRPTRTPRGFEED